MRTIVSVVAAILMASLAVPAQAVESVFFTAASGNAASTIDTNGAANVQTKLRCNSVAAAAFNNRCEWDITIHVLTSAAAPPPRLTGWAMNLLADQAVPGKIAMKSYSYSASPFNNPNLDENDVGNPGSMHQNGGGVGPVAGRFYYLQDAFNFTTGAGATVNTDVSLYTFRLSKRKTGPTDVSPANVYVQVADAGWSWAGTTNTFPVQFGNGATNLINTSGGEFAPTAVINITNVIPEPATLGMLAFGLVGLIRRARRTAR